MKGKLWLGHPTMPRQVRLAFKGKPARRPTQADVLLAALREERLKGTPLELPAIMRLGLARHSARINELRRRGFVIENEMERTSDGRVLSRYRLLVDPERDGVKP